MEFLKFLREEPVMAWFVLIALLVVVAPLASVLWHRIFGRNQVHAAKLPVQVIKPTRFDNRTEIAILLVGLMLLLAVIGWIRNAFFGQAI